MAEQIAPATLATRLVTKRRQEAIGLLGHAELRPAIVLEGGFARQSVFP